MSTELSRGELLNWVNDLTRLNLPKVELMGTGAAYCQILDSIYGDVPLHKVNFKAIHEYEYVHNFKIVQEAFTRHRIDRHIPVDRLIKLKFQDNLEFLQWMKRFWDAHYDGGAEGYDGANRRQTASDNGIANVRKTVRNGSIESTSNVINRPAPNTSSTSRPSSATTRPLQSSQVAASSTSASTATAPNALQLAALTKTITELKVTVDEMEKERDFYFNKLRDIEILTQKVSEPVVQSSAFYKQVTEVLYKTEEGFEIPQEEAIAGVVAVSAH